MFRGNGLEAWKAFPGSPRPFSLHCQARSNLPDMSLAFPEQGLQIIPSGSTSQASPAPLPNTLRAAKEPGGLGVAKGPHSSSTGPLCPTLGGLTWPLSLGLSLKAQDHVCGGTILFVL